MLRPTALYIKFGSVLRPTALYIKLALCYAQPLPPFMILHTCSLYFVLGGGLVCGHSILGSLAHAKPLLIYSGWAVHRANLYRGIFMPIQLLYNGYYTATCGVLPDGTVPSEIQLLPAADGEGRIVGRDGRWFKLSNPQAVVDKFGRMPIYGDYEHASEFTVGEIAPACAWVNALSVKTDNSIWATVDWTQAAAEMIRKHEYKYVSPVFSYNPETLEIHEILSFGLTNQPNLELQALNKRLMPVQSTTTIGEKIMNVKALYEALGLAETASEQELLAKINILKKQAEVLKSVCRALGLAETASEQDLLAAINMLQGQVGAVDPNKFVPKADYDIARSRAETLEAKIAKAAQKAFNDSVSTAVNKAVGEGKIAPASKEYHTQAIKTADDLERFKNTFAAAPAIISDGDTQMDPLALAKTPPSDTALTAEEQAICKQLGISQSDFAATRVAAQGTVY